VVTARGDPAIGKLQDVSRAVGMFFIPGARPEDPLMSLIPFARGHDIQPSRVGLDPRVEVNGIIPSSTALFWVWCVRRKTIEEFERNDG
jgi:hypothetical protein